MKLLTALLTVAPLLTPLYAHADFQPGRERPSAEGVLKVTTADGLYTGAEEATVTEYTSDGAGVTRFDVKLGDRTETYEVEAQADDTCGQQTYGRASDEAQGRSELRLLASNGRCRGLVAEWNLVIQTESPEASAPISTLKIIGNPEHFALTAGQSLGE